MVEAGQREGKGNTSSGKIAKHSLHRHYINVAPNFNSTHHYQLLAANNRHSIYHVHYTTTSRNPGPGRAVDQSMLILGKMLAFARHSPRTTINANTFNPFDAIC